MHSVSPILLSVFAKASHQAAFHMILITTQLSYSCTRPIIAYIAHQTMRCLQNRSRIIGLGLLEKRLCIMTCLFGVTETKLNIFRMKKRRFWAVSDGKQLNNGVTSHIRKLPIIARKIWLVKGSGSGFGSGFQMFWVLPLSDHTSSECV